MGKLLMIVGALALIILAFYAAVYIVVFIIALVKMLIRKRRR